MELLEDRCLLASDWFNTAWPEDVDRNQVVTPLDALIVINELNHRVVSDRSSGQLPSRNANVSLNNFLVDVTADGLVTQDDVRKVFNYLASDSNGTSRPSKVVAAPLTSTIPDEVLQAFYHAADLSQYSSEQLRSASGWVVLSVAQQNASSLRTQLGDSLLSQASSFANGQQVQLGNPNVSPTALIRDAYLVEWDSDALENAGSTATREMIQRLQSSESVLAFYPLVPLTIETRFVPNDALYASQWHLKNTGQSLGTPGMDVNIEKAWDRYQGNGIVIGIVDDGLQRNHPDLLPNSWVNPSEIAGNGIDDDSNGRIDDIYGWDFVDSDNDASPPPTEPHGTSVAGVAAGRGNNGIGITGAAPQAQLAGVRLLPQPDLNSAITDPVVASALSYQSQQIQIFNNSWGPIDNGVLAPIGPLALAALRSGATTGRDGLGNIYVWSAGNGYQSGDNSNYDGFANSRYVIAVGAVGADGSSSNYSEPGANVLVSAPSNNGDFRNSITTTDLIGADGYNPGAFDPIDAALCNPAATQEYTNCFGGTSAAAPVVAGIVALMLEANPNLTWRDVKHILVETAKPTSPDPLAAGWQENIAGKLFHHDFGFGLIDALAAVNRAETWTSVDPEYSSRAITTQVGSTIIDNGLAVTSTINASNIDRLLTIESVEVTLNATHEYNPDLNVVLTHTSPSGATSQSILALQRQLDGPLGLGSDGTEDYRAWKFSSVQHWGESTAGTWTLSIQDSSSSESSASGSFDSWTIQFHGTESSATASSLKSAIRELQLGITGATIIVPGFEPFDEAGGSMSVLAEAIRDRAAQESGNDTSWLLSYDPSTQAFNPLYSNFPVFGGSDFGGQIVNSAYSGNYAVSASDVSLDANGDEINADSHLVGQLGDLSTYVAGSIELSFRYDLQDLENLTEALSVDVYHNGAWQTGVWSSSFADDGDDETDAADWQLSTISLGSLGISNWSDVRFRFVASGSLDTLGSDEGGTPGVDEILIDDIKVVGNLISSPTTVNTIFLEDFEDPNQNMLDISDPDWRIVRGSDLDRSGEIVILFDWAKDSRRLSSGRSEATGAELFSLLVGLGIVDPGKAYAADAGTDAFTSNSHDFEDGDQVRLVGQVFPGGTNGTTTYFIVNATAITFQLSLTSNGPAIDVTTNGTGLVQLDFLDLHVIGHGSGAVVASEAVERMASYTIPVDHLTYLDPHDFDQGQVTDSAFRTDFANQPLGYGAVVWDNVNFADVYYQTRGSNNSLDPIPNSIVPQGRPIPGAVNYWIGPGGLYYLPNAANYAEGNVLGDHRYVWEGFYLSTINGEQPAVNELSELTEDTPTPATAIPVNTIGYAYSRVKSSQARPADNAFFGYDDRGSWTDGTLYEQGDVVKQGSTYYVARRTHTADGPTESQLGLSTGTQLLGRLSGNLNSSFPIVSSLTIDVTIGGDTETITLPPANLVDIATAAASLQTAIRSSNSLPAFTNAFVVPHVEGAQQRLIAAPGLPGFTIQFTNTGASTLLIDAASSNAVNALLSSPIATIPSLTADNDVRIDIGGTGFVSAQLTSSVSTLATIADELQASIRASQSSLPYSGARVAPVTTFTIPIITNRLLIIDGPGGGTISVQELSNQPVNATYWTALTGSPQFQDHRNSPGGVARGDGSTPDFAGLYQAGLSSEELVDARWQSLWNPNDVFNGTLIHVGDDILQRGERTIPAWTGERITESGPTLNLDLIRNVLTLSQDNPSVVHRSLFIDPNAESLSFQMRVATLAANDTLRVFLGDTLIGTPIAIPTVAIVPTAYAFSIPQALRGQVLPLRFELDGAFDGIVGEVEISQVALEGYATSIKAGDITQIDLGASITGTSGAFAISDPLVTAEREILLDPSFATNGKFHLIPIITNSNGKQAEFAESLWINFTEGGVAKTLRVQVEQGYSVDGSDRVIIPAANSVGTGGTNDPMQVRRVQQRLRYLNFRGHFDAMVPVDGNGTNSTFLQALKLFEAATFSPGPGNPAVAIEADGLISSGDSTAKWLNSPMAPGWTTLREGLQHPTEFDFRNVTTTWTHQALENALQSRPELHRIEGETFGFFSLTTYPDADPIQHGPDRSGLAFGMEIQQGSLNATGAAIDLSLTFDLNQPAITDAEREVIRDLLAIRDSAGTEIRNVLIGGTGAEPDHARLRSILTFLGIPNQAVAGHGDQIHVILSAPLAQTELTAPMQTALLEAIATLRDEAVDAMRMQPSLQNRLFTRHPDDTLESLLPLELAFDKSLYEKAVSYLSSTTNPTVEGIQQAMSRSIATVPIPDSDDALTLVSNATLTAKDGELQATFTLQANRIAATDQGTEDERLQPALDILDYEDATQHIAVGMDFEFDVTFPIQNSLIDQADVMIRRERMEVSAKSFNIRDYDANLFVMRVAATHAPVVLDGTLDISFDDEDANGNISVADLHDPFLTNKITVATSQSEFSGYLPVQPIACAWLPVGADPIVTMTDGDIFDGVPPTVVTNLDFDLLDAFTTLSSQDLFNALDQLRQGIEKLADALEPLEGIPFVEGALQTLVQIDELAAELAEVLEDGDVLLFATLQDLVQTLRAQLGLNEEEVYFDCSSAEQALYLNLDLQRLLNIPVDFALQESIEPLLLSGGIEAELAATLSIDLAVGFDLVPHALTQSNYLSTLVSDLNGNQGISTVAGNDIQVSLRDGTVYSIDIDAVNPATIQDAYDAVVAPSAGMLTYAVILHPDRDEVVGVEFYDATVGPNLFSIARANSSLAGRDLGVEGVDFGGDGVVEGILRTRSMLDRIFLVEGGGLQILGDFEASDIDASIGVAGVGGAIENGELEIIASASLKLVDPGIGMNADGRLTLRELFGSPLASIAEPSIKIEGEGRLPVVLAPAPFNALVGIDPNHPTTEAEDGPELNVAIFYELPTDIVPPPLITVTPNEQFEFLIDSFRNMSFNSVCDGITQVIAFLRSSEFTLFNQKLPLLNRSINELIDTDTLLSDVIDVLCVDLESLKEDVEAILPDFENPTVPVGAIPAMYASLNAKQQAEILQIRDALHSALGQEDLAGLPTDLASIVGSLRDFMDSLPNTVNTSQLNAFTDQLDALLPTLDKIETRVETALGLAPNDFEMEFADLDNNPTTFTRGLIFRLTLGAGYNDNLALDFPLNTLDGPIPIGVSSGGAIQLGLNGTLQLDFGIDLSPGVDLEDRLFMVAYDGVGEGTRLELTADAHTNPQLSGSLTLGGIDLVTLGPAQVSLRELQTKQLTGVASQVNYPISPVIPNAPTNVLDAAFVRVNGQMRVASSYSLAFNQLSFSAPLPAAGDVIEILYPGTNPASYTLSLEHVVTPDDPQGDPERILRFSRLFDGSDAFTWNDDFINSSEIDGVLAANLPLAVPLLSPFTVRAFWDLSDPTNPYFEFPADLGTQLGASNSCNLPGITSSITAFLNTLEAGLASDVLEKLPLIGNLDLDKAGVFIHDMRQTVDPMLLAMGSSAALRSYLFENLGPGTLSGTGLKLDILVHDHDNDDNTPPVPITSVNDIGLGESSGKEIWVDIPTSGLDCAQFQLHVGGTFTAEADFDLGLGGVNVEVNTSGGVELTAGFDVQMGFGLSKASGAYVLLNDDQSDPEVELQLGVGLAANTSLDLRLFFLQLSAAEKIGGPSTGFSLDVMVDLEGPTDPSKLTFQEIAQTPLADIATFEVEGSVNVDLTLTAGTSNPALPSIKVDLWVDWGFEFGEAQPFMGQDVTVEFNNLRVDLGGYLTKIVQPIVQKIDESLKPLDPLIEFLEKEIPLISDVRTRLGMDAIRVLDMARLFGDGAESAVDFIDQVISIRQIVGQLASAPTGTSFEIQFGNFLLGNSGGLTDPRSSSGGINPNTQPPAAFSGTADDLDQIVDNNVSTPGDVGFFAGILDTLRDFGVEFPLLDSPGKAFGLLFGQNVDFVTYDFLGVAPEDRLQTTFSWTQNFGPLLPPVPLYAQVGASFTMFADFKVGFDSAGLKKGAQFIDGFYFDDTRPVLGLEAQFTAGAELNAALVWGGVQGGVEASIGAGWNDINNDGKFRIKELVSRFQQGPQCVFDLGGEMNVFLEVYGGVGIKVFKKIIPIFEARKELLNANIFRFNVSCPPVPPPVLAHVTSNTLVLNIGPHASLRQPGATDGDDQVEVYFDTDSASPTFNQHVVSGFGHVQAYSGVQQILVEGGAGNDQVTIDGSVTVPVTAYGGDGNDNIAVLATGTLANPNLLYGGAGNDRLVAGPGVDRLFGEDGDDVLIAGDGDDYLEGNAGDDSLDGGGGDDELRGGTGNDGLDGGSGADQLYGESGNDSLAGGLGLNLLIGADGNDFIAGGDDPTSFDTIDAGAGDDIIHAKAGNDIVDGGDGNDLILGGDGDDQLVGGAGNDQIDGELGSDHYYFDVVAGVAEEDTLSEPLGSGVDLLDFSTLPVGDDLTMNLTSGVGRHVKRTIRLINPSAFENVTSGAGNDALIDNSANNLLNGGLGDDRYVFGAFPLVSSTHIDTLVEAASAGTDWIDFRDLGSSEPVVIDLSGSGIFVDPIIALHTSRTLRTLLNGQHNNIENIRGGSGDDELTGNSSINHIQGGPGDDEIRGLGANDFIEGNAGGDLIFGGNDNDVIEGGSESDTIYGEAGNDLIRGGADDDTIYGNLGADELYGDADDDLIYGNEGPDLIYGGNNDDVIFGNDGDDIIEGNRGIDLVWGGNGKDQIFGNEGNDRLFGQADDDTISGGPGRDILVGDVGNDDLIGGSGDDLLSGGADGSNGFVEFVSIAGSIRTATGSYTYAPRSFGDRIDGGSGHDLVLGGNITLSGTIGDALSSQEQLAYEVFVDVLRDLVDEYQASLTLSVTDEQAFADYLKTVTTSISSATPDGDDIMFGGTENDLLIGHDGEDYLFGDHGRDVLLPYRIGTVAVLTNDWVEGGPDDDRLLCGTYADNVMIGGTSDLNLQRTLLASAPHSPLSVGGGYVVPSCVINEVPTLDPIVPVSLRGQKFLDRNGNQLRDVDEPGLNGWTIELRDLEGEIIGTSVTMNMDLNLDGIIDPMTETGLFWFTDTSVGGNVQGLNPGTYQLSEATQSGSAQTYPLTGGQYPLPSGHVMTGVDVAIGPSQFVKGYAISLQTGEQATGITFGNAPLGEVRGFKFDDLDGDGIRDTNEPFLPGWQITLQDANSNIQTTTTDAAGRYSFSNLIPGSFTITEAIPPGWVQSTPGLTSGYAHVVSVGFGEVVNNLDFGNVKLASVSGFKWEDLNGDGVQDVNESAPTLPFQIQLMDSLGNPTLVTTDSNGNFTFSGLYPGIYTLSEVVPSNWVQTYPSGDSFGEYQFVVSSGDVLGEYRFGNYQNSSITGIKWNDVNGNGIYESSSEFVIPGWQVYLDLDGSGIFDTGEPLSITDNFGVYQFSGLAPGDYTVAEVPAPGWIQSYPGAASNQVHQIKLISGMQLANLDFGNVIKSSVDGVKWLDLNGDGIRDQNEPGLPNWRIFIDLNQNGKFDEADPSIPGSVTEPFVITSFDDPDTPIDETGWYQFDNLLPGTYTIAEEMQAGWQQSYPGNARVPGTTPFHVVTLQSKRATGVSFGNYRPGVIEGLKWHDVNGDGVRQLITSGPHRGDVGLGRWIIYLDINRNGMLDRDPATGDSLEPIALTTQDIPTTPENEAGNFAFAGLRPGEYIVAEELQTGWVQSQPAQSGVNNHRVRVDEGGHVTVEFANSQSSTIIGVKWWDQNLNRSPDQREPFLANWVIYLDLNHNGQLDFDAAGMPGEPTAITNSNGVYTFQNLLPGFYVVAELPQPHWSITYPTLSTVNRHLVQLDGGTLATSMNFGNTVLGDCNFDLKVDKVDARALQTALNSKVGSPKYNACFDFDQDMDVDADDAQIFYANYGIQAALPTLPPWAQPRSRQLTKRLLPGSRDVNVQPEATRTVSVQYSLTDAFKFGLPQKVRPSDFYSTAFEPGSPPNDRLHQIDSLTAGLSPIGVTERLLIGMAEASDGTVWGLSQTGRLVTINLNDGSTKLVHQLPRGFMEGDIAIRPGDEDSLWVTTERSATLPAELIRIQLSTGTILNSRKIPLALSEYGFSGMQFLDANTLYLYEPQTNKLVITDVQLLNPVEIFLSDGPIFATRAGIDFDSNGNLWIVAKQNQESLSSFLYYVDKSGQNWTMVAREPGQSSSQWTSLLIVDRPREELGSIEGIKWHDGNGNGIREPNEPGLAGWQIQVSGTTSLGKPFSAMTVTMEDDPLTDVDETGGYFFASVPVGNYVVTEVMQPGWFQSFPVSGSHQVTPEDIRKGAVANFGNLQFGMIHGTKYELGGPIGERPLAGWEIIISGVDIFGNQVQYSTVTMTDNQETQEDETGQYWFNELLPGSYRIEEIQQPGWFVAFPREGFYDYELQSGGENPPFNFTNYRGGTITGLVFQDFVDCEGSYSSGDEPLMDAVVYIDENDDGVLNRDILNNPLEPFTTTDANGFYQFVGLPFGNYRIRHEPVAGAAVSYPASQSYLVTISTSGQLAAELDIGVFTYTPLEDGGDLMYASLGADTVYGDNIVLNRCILSFGGDDRIHGEEGNDLLIGQRRNDTYFFLPSSDPNEIDTLIELDDRGTDERDDEGRHDRLDFSALEVPDPVEVDLSGSRLGWPANWIAFHQAGANQRVVLTDVAGQNSNLEDALGGNGDDSLTGNAKANWLSGGSGSDRLAGLGGDDELVFSAWFAGDVDTIVEPSSADGTDTLNFSAIAVPVTVDLMSSILGSYGGATVVSSTPQWFDNVIGGQVDDWIRGNLADNVLQGGLGNDTYLFQGLWGNDTVVELPGEGTDDVLDFSGATALVTSTISNTLLTTTDGLGNLVTHQGNHVERLETGTNLHHVIGGNSANVWTLDGLFTGTLHGVRFQNAPNITGGPQTDDFVFLSGGQIQSISGGSGTDTIHGPDVPSAWQVVASGQGDSSFVAAFNGIEQLVGGSDTDTLQGPTAAVTWQVTEASGGTMVGYLDFTGFERLDGGGFADDFELGTDVNALLDLYGQSGDDRLLFATASALAGRFDGGLGTDTLDYSPFGTSIVVNLQTLAATGLNEFADVESLVGTGDEDSLIGPDLPNTWNLMGAQGTVGSLAFEDFEIFEGGTDDDEFYVSNTLWNITLRGNQGDDLYEIEFGSLLGTVQVEDNASSTADLIRLLGTNGDDSWAIDASSASLLGQQVFYNGDIEQLFVDGLDGDDSFAVIPSLDTEMFLDGGNHVVGDELTVDKLGQTYIDNGSQVLVAGYQAVNYVNFEQLTVQFQAGTKKTRLSAKQVDLIFDRELW